MLNYLLFIDPLLLKIMIWIKFEQIGIVQNLIELPNYRNTNCNIDVPAYNRHTFLVVDMLVLYPANNRRLFGRIIDKLLKKTQTRRFSLFVPWKTISPVSYLSVIRVIRKILLYFFKWKKKFGIFFCVLLHSVSKNLNIFQ